ncbi:uroporphyrinogen-III C-methyltransferase [Sulfurihydrogenibium subterraneum]|uniref:uroporphyrinogen-III C-methyltransferase n=1 Tax=Sulfurihydrogenibium subterraneum TaxID=171121 RepID=UPI00049131D9|nr:uroporphyrinogen-III C-methyltransferase [Sulfurihydrogenibium subterraneum]
MGKVYIVGAGPGDVELLTLKALKIIQNADVILYDRLVNEEILNFAKKDAQLVYVGKEDGKHTIPQEEINRLLYKYALTYDTVLRLKGGDPFVFGRGSEEALYLSERNIEYEIVPGITSAIAVLAYAGIPVTHRGISSSFRVVTGHEAPDKENSSIDWESMKADETLIFLMGLHNIEKIMKKLIEIGKDSKTPVAVIQSGTTLNQRVVVGTIENIVELSKDLQPPSIIVVGEVVKLREKIAWFEKVIHYQNFGI